MVKPAKGKRGGEAQHTWRVTRRNNESVSVTAGKLSVLNGDLVFSTGDLTARVIPADTYNDVELIGPANA